MKKSILILVAIVFNSIVFAQIQDLNVTCLEATHYCAIPSGGVHIKIEATEIGVLYALKNSANTTIISAQGSGGDITFSIPVPATETYHILATSGSNSLELTQTVTITIDILDLGVTVNGSEITVNTTNYASYLWYDCTLETSIIGETGISFTPTQSGSYSCEISNNGCSDLSECQTITISEANLDENLDEKISIFPNPVNDNLSVLLPSELVEENYFSIYTIQGEKVMQAALLLDNSVTELESGSYFLVIETNKGNITKTFYKN